MLPNKRNMWLDTIGYFFLFPRSDVSEVRRFTSDPNEHTYGMWRMILCEFNREQLIIIVQNNNSCMEYIFESDLDISRSNTSFKVYQSTLYDFNKNLKRGSFMSGPVGYEFFSLDVHL